MFLEAPVIFKSHVIRKFHPDVEHIISRMKDINVFVRVTSSGTFSTINSKLAECR